MSSTIASHPDSRTTKDTRSKSTQPLLTQIQRTSLFPLLTYKSEAHQQLSEQTAQEAHTETGVSNKGHPPDNQSTTHAVATLCLHKPWRQRQRPSLKPLYLEEMTSLPLATNIRTLSISETHSTSPLGKHWEVLADLEDLEGLEGPETPTEEQYPPLISFLFNPQET